MSESFFYIQPFLGGLVFGTILVFLFKEQKVIIMDYPKPYDKKIFTDKNSVKYTYVTKEVNCDTNEKTLKSYPLQ